MTSVTFTITRDEIEELAQKKFSDKQLQEILTAIENDPVLWKEIERTIVGAINFIESSQ